MDVQLIKDLVKVMDKGNLSKLHVKEKGGFEVSLERGHTVVEAPKAHFHHAPPQEFLPPAASQSKAAEKPAHEASGDFITSPMVGTFYNAPSPDDPAFVKVGDRVEKGAVVCIVEAMKVMNEVKSDRAGVIKEILIDNMQPVEFGTKLYRIE